ncbi:hypothetical protein M501DRAFT_1034517 [Patellaria atrata CBS 101060]|uniref:Uncharacterized protein n=1 Tax=Patellaria atrata CBS 101060 TaxID=1346257 RepID=A0A9P4S4Z7_9PEZI|nr:hypothetical protein M501DRAFT_1034517 [Patellaria atrata CBS 101060]
MTSFTNINPCENTQTSETETSISIDSPLNMHSTAGRRAWAAKGLPKSYPNLDHQDSSDGESTNGLTRPATGGRGLKFTCDDESDDEEAYELPAAVGGKDLLDFTVEDESEEEDDDDIHPTVGGKGLSGPEVTELYDNDNDSDASEIHPSTGGKSVASLKKILEQLKEDNASTTLSINSTDSTDKLMMTLDDNGEDGQSGEATEAGAKTNNDTPMEDHDQTTNSRKRKGQTDKVDPPSSQAQVTTKDGKAAKKTKATTKNEGLTSKRQHWSQEEKEWIFNYFRKNRDHIDEQATVAFNDHFRGKVINGVLFKERTKSAISAMCNNAEMREVRVKVQDRGKNALRKKQSAEKRKAAESSTKLAPKKLAIKKKQETGPDVGTIDGAESMKNDKGKLHLKVKATKSSSTIQDRPQTDGSDSNDSTVSRPILKSKKTNTSSTSSLSSPPSSSGIQWAAVNTPKTFRPAKDDTNTTSTNSDTDSDSDSDAENSVMAKDSVYGGRSFDSLSQNEKVDWTKRLRNHLHLKLIYERILKDPNAVRLIVLPQYKSSGEPRASRLRYPETHVDVLGLLQMGGVYADMQPILEAPCNNPLLAPMRCGGAEYTPANAAEVVTINNAAAALRSVSSRPASALEPTKRIKRDKKQRLSVLASPAQVVGGKKRKRDADVEGGGAERSAAKRIRTEAESVSGAETLVETPVVTGGAGVRGSSEAATNAAVGILEGGGKKRHRDDDVEDEDEGRSSKRSRSM